MVRMKKKMKKFSWKSSRIVHVYCWNQNKTPTFSIFSSNKWLISVVLSDNLWKRKNNSAFCFDFNNTLDCDAVVMLKLDGHVIWAEITYTGIYGLRSPLNEFCPPLIVTHCSGCNLPLWNTVTCTRMDGKGRKLILLSSQNRHFTSNNNKTYVYMSRLKTWYPTRKKQELYPKRG